MIEFVDVADLSMPENVWSEVVSSSPEAWIWTSWNVHQFRISNFVSAATSFRDISFVVMKDGVVVGLAPLVVFSSGSGEQTRREAGYSGAPLPWPCISSGTDIEIESLIFDEIERRAVAAGAGKISLIFSPPIARDESTERFYRTLRNRNFMDVSYSSHMMPIESDFLSKIRPKYRQNIRKFSNKYELSIVSGPDLPPGLAGEYMTLHVKDAGAQYRTLATYEAQLDVTRAGEGFCVVARNKDADQNVGMLMIWYLKGSAFDASVAVDPDFQHEPVSNLLKLKAVEALLANNVVEYEIGEVSVSPNYFRQPTEKNYGISFFKNGWSRGRRKTVFVAEKYYNAAHFAADWKQKQLLLEKHFQI